MTAAQLEQKPELNDQWLRPALLGRISTPDEYRGASAHTSALVMTDATRPIHIPIVKR